MTLTAEAVRAHRDLYAYENGAFQRFVVGDWRPSDLGWLAGILDGEGSFAIVRRRAGKRNGGGRVQLRDHYTVQITVGSIDAAIVERCHAITAVGRLTSRNMKHRLRRLHIWTAAGWDARAVSLIAYDYLVAKQNQAEMMLGDLNEETWAALRAIHRRNGGGDAE